MLKRNITYVDFNGDTVTEVFYFNLSKSELVEMELSTKDGFGETLQRIIKAEDNKSLVAEFKKIILGSYGQKSVDGKRFDKNDTLREEFSQTAAYDALFMELAQDADAANVFIQGILPTDMSKDLIKAATNPSSEEIIERAQESIKNPITPSLPTAS
jgi:hypothetical protein